MLKLPSSPAHSASALPPQPFFALAPQRVRLARERYFDQGQRPTGLVAEPVIQSWARCVSARQRPHDSVAFDPVSRSRMQAALARNRPLLLAAADELQRLEAAVGGTGCRVLLTDAEGVVVHATPGGGRARELLPIVSRVGVNLAEAAVGTNAPAVVLKTGQACAVSGAEHFFESVQRLHCAAAPIRDQQGDIAGVLDLTVEARPFGFDGGALVGIVATAIENRLLQQGNAELLVLQFQVAHSLLDSPLQALVGVTGSGRLAWANGIAHQLLGLSLQRDDAPSAEALFGQGLNELLALSGSLAAHICRLPSGLTVWMRAQRPGCRVVRNGGPSAPAAPGGQTGDPLPGRSMPSCPEPTAMPCPALDGAASDATIVRAGECLTSAAPGSGDTAGSTDGAGPLDRTATTDGGWVALDDTAGAQAPASAPPTDGAAATAPTLVDHQRALIDQVLAECAGNISQAARRLGVSRGLLYRRRRDAQAAEQPTATGDGKGPDTAPDHREVD